MSRAQHPALVRGAVCAAVAASAAALAVAAAANAAATPPSGVIPVPLGTVNIGGTDLTARVIVFSPSGTTGWHTHDGDVPGIVTGGFITRTLEDCSVYTAGPGDPMSGGGAAHVGANTGDTTAFLWSLYIDQAGDPPAIDAPAADCPGR
ncbi:cupin domain-containing protein [Tomitella fengzijianii]|uniref:Cupin domain-containing protein n=1 Tax=Tomitella fengzijianii TaxID=2597660 RepID=A0A516X2Q4_9ACTN|nr:cupin domain-containing protein [Tomitella fengzijianii]QDQ96911.1 cupin domain-containing protein [Tomitella fengzijianii]